MQGNVKEKECVVSVTHLDQLFFSMRHIIGAANGEGEKSTELIFIPLEQLRHGIETILRN